MANTCPKQWYCSVSEEGCTAEKMADCKMVPKQGDPSTMLFVALLGRSQSERRLARSCPSVERILRLFLDSMGNPEDIQWIIHDVEKVLRSDSTEVRESYYSFVETEVKKRIKDGQRCVCRPEWITRCLGSRAISA